MSDEPLQFGAAEIGVDYRHRPAAFGIARRDDGKIAMVKVTVEGLAPWFDLPGGALESGEDDPAALVREFGEETGLKVRAGLGRRPPARGRRTAAARARSCG